AEEPTGEEAPKRKIFRIDDKFKMYGSFGDTIKPKEADQQKQEREQEEEEPKKKPEPPMSAKAVLISRVKIGLFFVAFLIAMIMWLFAAQANPEIVEQVRQRITNTNTLTVLN